MSLLLNEQSSYTKSSSINWYNHVLGPRVIGDFTTGDYIQFALTGLQPGRYSAVITYVSGGMTVKLASSSWNNSLRLPYNTPGTYTTEVTFNAATDFLRFENIDPNSMGSLASIELTLVEAFRTPTPTIDQPILRPPSSNITGSGPNGSTIRLYRNGVVVSTTPCTELGYLFVGASIIGGQKYAVTAQLPGLPESPLSASITAQYANAQLSQSFKRSDCGSDFVGTLVTYTVPRYTYFGLTQTEADAPALQEIAANGQAYANLNGSCTPKVQTAAPTINQTVLRPPSGNISGTAPIGSLIRLYRNGVMVVTTPCTELGYIFVGAYIGGGWVYEVTAQMPDEYESQKTRIVAQYGNTAQSQTFQRNNCGSDFNGTNITYTVKVNTYFGVTQAEADTLAQADIATNGQNYANTNGVCTLKPQTPTPAITSTVLRPVATDIAGTGPASASIYLYQNGTYVAKTTTDQNGNFRFVGVSMRGGDVNEVTAWKSGSLESAKSAPVVTQYGNVALSQSFQRDNCGSDYIASSVTYSVSANTYFAGTQSDANGLAQADIAANGQAYANTNGTCTLKPLTPTPTLAPNPISNLSTLAGTAQAGATVRLYRDGQVVATVTADADGKYTFPKFDIQGGQSFQVSAQSPNERESPLSQPIIAKFLNSALTFALFSKVCAPNYKPQPYNYEVPYGKYLADTQADADAKALQDVQTIGQEQANANGVCQYIPQTETPVLSPKTGPFVVETTYLDPTTLQINGTGTPGATIRLYRDGQLADTLVIPATGTFSFFLRPEGGASYTLTSQVLGQRESGLSVAIVAWYGNVEKTVTLRRNDCRPRYRGSEVVYTVPANRYVAETQQEADDTANAEINENAQTYANENGVCELLPPPFLIDPAVPGMEFRPIRMVRNTLLHNIQEADPATYPNREQLRYYLEILKPEYYNATAFDRLTLLKGSEKPPYNQAGVTIYEGATFLYDRLIDGLLTYHKPEPRQDYLSIAHGLTTPFRFREEIRVGEQPIAQQELITEYAIKAGLKERDSLTYAETYFTNRQAETWQFLTWQPIEKTTSPQAEEYLYYLLNFTPVPKQIRVRVRVHFDDGTTQLLTVANTRVRSYRLYQVVCCPVGMKALGLDKLTQPVRKYEVWLSNEQNQQFTEVRTYHPNGYYVPQERHILFTNSLGGVDALRLTGEGTESLKVQRNLAEVIRSDSSVQELRIISVQGNRALTVQTGWLRRNVREWLSYMNELLLSENIYLVDDKGHMGLILETSDLIDHRDDSELVSLQLTFRYAHTERNYSNLPPADLQRERPTAWRPYGTPSCELDSYFKRTGRAVFPQIELYYMDTGESVRPRQIKLNLEDDPDHIGPVQSDVCLKPAYLNTEINRKGSFRKQDCNTQPYLTGNFPDIVIPAGQWGSETSQTEADARAEAEWQRLNTQAYADQYGTCQLAPFVNVEIRRNGSFGKQGCQAPQVGTTAEIVVPPARFGSMVSQAEADALAELEFKRLDTQEYANQYGVCGIPALYGWNVPAGHWHYRTNRPDLVSVDWWDGGDQSQNIGNVSWRYNPAIRYNFPGGSNDLDFPANSAQYPTDGFRWRLGVDGPSEPYTLNVYIDGVLQHTSQLSGLNYFHMPVPIIAGGKYYIEVV